MQVHLYVGVCPSDAVEMCGVTGLTGNLKLLSFQTNKFYLTDRQGWGMT